MGRSMPTQPDSVSERRNPSPGRVSMMTESFARNSPGNSSVACFTLTIFEFARTQVPKARHVIAWDVSPRKRETQPDLPLLPAPADRRAAAGAGRARETRISTWDLRPKLSDGTAARFKFITQASGWDCQGFHQILGLVYR